MAEFSPTTSTILPPRFLTVFAPVISTLMPIEARKLTAVKSTTRPFFGAAVSSASRAETRLVPGVSRRPEITIRRRSSPTSSWRMVDMAIARFYSNAPAWITLSR